MKIRDSRRDWCQGLSMAAKWIRRGQKTGQRKAVGGLDDFDTVYDCRQAKATSGRDTHSERLFTHAVQQPSSPTDQMVAYQIIPTMESPTCRKEYCSAMSWHNRECSKTSDWLFVFTYCHHMHSSASSLSPNSSTTFVHPCSTKSSKATSLTL